MAEFKSARRYYLAKRHEAIELWNDPQALVWQGKQESEPGTALPDDFPFVERLRAAGYSATTDLDGADACELARSEFTAREAAFIFAELTTIL